MSDLFKCPICGDVLSFSEVAIDGCPKCHTIVWPLKDKKMEQKEELKPYGLEQGTVSESGGARAGTKKPRVSLVPLQAIIEVAKVMTMGAAKYGECNWQKGMPHSWHLDAALRHLIAVSGGEMKDKESGLEHLAHAAADILMLLESRLKDWPRDDLSNRTPSNKKD